MNSQLMETATPQEVKAPKIRRLGWLLLYAALAFAANWSINYFSLGQWPILFGTIFVFLAFLHLGLSSALPVAVAAGLALWPQPLAFLPPAELLLIGLMSQWRAAAFGALVAVVVICAIPLLVLIHLVFNFAWINTESLIVSGAIEGLVVILSAYLAEAISKLPPFRNKAAPFRSELSEYFTLFSALPVIFLLIWSTTSYSEKLSDQFAQQIRTHQHISLERLQNHLETYKHLLSAIAATIDANDERQKLQRYLVAIHNEFPNFKTLFIADFNGQLLASSPDLLSDNTKPKLSIQDRTYFKAAAISKRPYISQVFRGRGPGQKPIVVISIPLLKDNGGFTGVLAGSLQLNRMRQLLHHRPDSTMALIDATNHIIVATGKDAAESLTPVTPNSPLAFGLKHTNYFGRTSNGDALISVTTVTNSGWKLVYHQPLQKTINEINFYTLIISTVAWLFVVTSRHLANRLAGQMAEPIERLEQTAAQIRPNKPLVPFKTDANTPAEIARLAKTLNHTLHELEIARLKLKRTASEKTELYEQLQRQNQSLDELIKAKTEALVKAKQEAETLAANRSAYLATMSHEVKTPLSGILGMLSLFERDNLSKEQQEQLETIKQCAQSLLQLINDILDSARMESGVIRLNLQVLDVHSVCEEVTKLFRSNAQAKGLQLEYTIDPEVQALSPILGDVQRIKQVLSNLISNAIKFSNEGKVRLVVTRYRTEQTKVWLKFTVIDQGVGIPKEHLDRIFRPFEQLEYGKQPAENGSGLGLSISRKLAILMGGHLDAHSIPGQSTQFHLLIPLRFVDATSDGTQHSENSGKQPTAARILVVEDNIVNQKILGSILRNQNFTYHLVNNGKECINALEKENYDLVFMDCQMPEMDGFEATRRIRASGRPYANIPIIAVTAHASPLDRERCLAAGMNDHIGKPYSVDRIREVLAQFLTENRDVIDKTTPDKTTE